MATLNLSQDKLVFDDEFNSLSLRSTSNPNGIYDTQYIFGGRTLSSNNEAEFYIDPSYNNLGIDPFSVNNGVMTITASKTPSNILSQVQNLPYLSGLIETDKSFAQTYGVFEMRAQLPAGQGLWPAFWLLPSDGSWPPEIDVMEVLGNAMTKLYTTIHSSTAGTSGASPTVANMSTGYHTYAVDWEPNTITFYFDGQEVYQVATPSDMHKPMYMIANLGVGGAGSWPGATNSSTPIPANMNIDYIRAYASANTIAGVDTAPAPNTTSDSTPGPDAGTTPPVVTPPVVTPPVVTPPVVTPPVVTPPVVTPPVVTPPVVTPPVVTPPVVTPPVVTPQADPPMSAAPVTQLTGGSTPGTLTAGSQPTKFYSLNGHDTFVAGSGDDTFLITNAEKIVLPTVHGVETVQWWGSGSYTLQAGITDLVMMHGGTGIGNAQPNQLIASAWGNTLVAGTAHDVMTGGAGADTFVIKGGIGAVDDTVANLGSTDHISISNSYADFATAKSHMSQVGADTVLDMGGGQTLTLRGVALASVTAGEFTFASPASGGGTVVPPVVTPPVVTPPVVTPPVTPQVDPPMSAAPVTQLTGGSTPGTLTAGSQPTKFYSLNGHDTFVAGSGDDTFLITNAEKIVLPSVHGVETVQWWGNGSYTLQAGITDLVMMHGGTGIGNAQPNQLIASAWGNTLVAGTAHDVMTGGAGADTFVIKGGIGAVDDTIVKLGSTDHISISNSYADFATAKSHMSQVGADTVLAMSGGQTLTLRGVALTAVTAGEFTFASPATTTTGGSTGATTGAATGTTTTPVVDPVLHVTDVHQLMHLGAHWA